MQNLAHKTLAHNEQQPSLQQLAANLSGIELVAAIATGQLPPPPMAQTMPIELTHWSNGSIEIEGLPQKHFYNNHGSIHGGWVMTMLDTSMALAALTTLSAGESCPSTETSVKFVRPITVSTGKMIITGQVINKGRKLITLEGRIMDTSGKLYAHGTSTCMIVKTK
jgi:uncharacterized protein (TIGR00369 family)